MRRFLTISLAMPNAACADMILVLVSYHRVGPVIYTVYETSPLRVSNCADAPLTINFAIPKAAGADMKLADSR